MAIVNDVSEYTLPAPESSVCGLADGRLCKSPNWRLARKARVRAERTALRSTDIVMDRVWQLETETFQDSPSFVFAPITEVVELAGDSTALHPEIQRQALNIRTDLDRFSPLEISGLVRHGYCVGRKVCRAHPGKAGSNSQGRTCNR